MPRLVIAAILISLSWPLMQFFVEFVNSLGLGVQNIIYSPFSAANINSININLSGGADTALAIVGGPAIVALGIFGLLSFALTGALALFVTFLILIIRQILILILIIFSPLAILMMILPNTQKHFKKWFDEFSKALLMFPIIVALIAAGRVFAVLSVYNNPKKHS